MHSYAERESEADARPDRGSAAEPKRPERAATAGGLPPRLRTNLEAMSGFAMGDVRVHRNSSEPAQLGALAMARGSDIHLGPGQERHLPHEAWHVVQQRQGRVAATQLKGGALNHDRGLEAEADLMGAAAAGAGQRPCAGLVAPRGAADKVTQLKVKDADRWLKPSEPMSPTLLKLVKSSHSYLLRSDFSGRLDVAPVHVLDMSKKYLLGEIHGPPADARWAKDTTPWSSVAKLVEEGKAVPREERSRVGLPKVAPGPDGEPLAPGAEQALESLHAWDLLQTIRLHDNIGTVASDWIQKYWKSKDKTLRLDRLRDFGVRARILKSDCAEYEKYIQAYEGLKRRPGGQAKQVYEFAVRFRDEYKPYLHRLAELMTTLEVAVDLYDENDPFMAKLQAEAFEAASKEMLGNRTLLPRMARELMGLCGLGRKKRRELNAFLTDKEVPSGTAIGAAMMPVRDQAMARSIAAVRSPLLARMGNDHLTGVRDLVGRAAVTIDWPKSLETETAHP